MKPASAIARFCLLVPALVLLAGPAQAAPYPKASCGLLFDVKDTVKSEPYEVKPGGTLYIDLDRGNIEVETTDRDVVLVELERSVDVEGRDEAKALFERHAYAFEQKGNDVFVRSRYAEEEGLFGRWRSGGDFELRVIVRVPEAYNVDFTSGAGNAEIAGLEGRVEGRTGAGNIKVGAIRGTVEIASGSGNIQVEGGSGFVDVRSGAGNIELRDVRGEVEAKTGAGNIAAYIVRQPEGDSELESGAGNVTVYLAPSVAVDVEAKAALGAASTDFPLEVEGKWMSKSFEGSINGGGPGLTLRSGVGNVVLRRQ